MTRNLVVWQVNILLAHANNLHAILITASTERRKPIGYAVVKLAEEESPKPAALISRLVLLRFRATSSVPRQSSETHSTQSKCRQVSTARLLVRVLRRLPSIQLVHATENTQASHTERIGERRAFCCREACTCKPQRHTSEPDRASSPHRRKRNSANARDSEGPARTGTHQAKALMRWRAMHGSAQI